MRIDRNPYPCHAPGAFARADLARIAASVARGDANGYEATIARARAVRANRHNRRLGFFARAMRAMFGGV